MRDKEMTVEGITEYLKKNYDPNDFAVMKISTTIYDRMDRNSDNFVNIINSLFTLARKRV